MSAQLAAIKAPSLYVDRDIALRTLRRSKLVTRLPSDPSWPNPLWCRANFDTALQDAYLKQVVEHVRVTDGHHATAVVLKGVITEPEVQNSLREAHACYLSWLARNRKLSTMRALIDDLGLCVATPRLMANRLRSCPNEQRADMIGDLAVLPGEICMLIADALVPFVSKNAREFPLQQETSRYSWLF